MFCFEVGFFIFYKGENFMSALSILAIQLLVVAGQPGVVPQRAVTKTSGLSGCCRFICFL
jgi:hypothetical protein